MINNYQKEIQTKLTKGLLDMIILQLLDQTPMHGYQVITRIRKSFGVYFGASTVYPVLGALEKKGLLKSVWDMDGERPRKIYHLTNEGQTILNFAEGSLIMICKNTTEHRSSIETPKSGALTQRNQNEMPLSPLQN